MIEECALECGDILKITGFGCEVQLCLSIEHCVLLYHKLRICQDYTIDIYAFQLINSLDGFGSKMVLVVHSSRCIVPKK